MRPTRDWVHVISCGTFTPRRYLCGGRKPATSTALSTPELDGLEGPAGRRYVPLRWDFTGLSVGVPLTPRDCSTERCCRPVGAEVSRCGGSARRYVPFD